MTVADALGEMVDHVARDGGLAILPYNAWTAIGAAHQARIIRLARLLGVSLAVTLPVG